MGRGRGTRCLPSRKCTDQPHEGHRSRRGRAERVGMGSEVRVSGLRLGLEGDEEVFIAWSFHVRSFGDRGLASLALVLPHLLGYSLGLVGLCSLVVLAG